MENGAFKFYIILKCIRQRLDLVIDVVTVKKSLFSTDQPTEAGFVCVK